MAATGAELQLSSASSIVKHSCNDLDASNHSEANDGVVEIATSAVDVHQDESVKRNATW